MAYVYQREVAQTDHENPNKEPQSPSLISEIQILLITILKMLEPYVRTANIELKSGERVSINEDWEAPIQFHCGEEKRPCSDVEMIEAHNGELFALCNKLAKSPDFAAQLERVKLDTGRDLGSRLKPLPVISAGISKEDSMFGRNAEPRRLILDYIINVVRGMGVEEKAELLSVFGESEFNAFLNQSGNMEQLQSIQYSFTRRINRLKTCNARKAPKRPVKEQRKVGDYLYILQPAQKGGDYWYLQFTENGRRKHIYLGKEEPLFKPQDDLVRKRKAKAKSAHA